MSKRRKPRRPALRRPLATQLDPDMSLAEKMARIRRRVAAKGYFDPKHPRAKIVTNDKVCHPRGNKLRRADQLNLNSYARRSFTSQEIEQMWLALCRLMDFFGGNKALAVRECKMSEASFQHWIRLGRISPLGADVIGNNPQIPFSRRDLRPDINAKGWQMFDRKKAAMYRKRAAMQGSEPLEDDGLTE